MPGLPVHHQLPEFTQTHVHQVSDAIQLFHPPLSPYPAPNPSQHQGLFQLKGFHYYCFILYVNICLHTYFILHSLYIYIYVCVGI